MNWPLTKVCALNILRLSAPSFAAVFWAMRALAATRPRQAGAAAGLLASAIATAAYCLHCPEMSPAFWALWYVLGMSLPAALGRSPLAAREACARRRR